MQVDTSYISKSGGRKINQDTCGFYEKDNHMILFVLDGLGGHYGGEIASSIVAQSILDSFVKLNKFDEKSFKELLIAANNTLLMAQQQNPKYQSMQTTLVLAFSNIKNTLLVNIGDCRGYLFSDGKIEMQTEDHSLSQLLVKQGELSKKEIRNHEDRNKVLQSMGKENQINPTFYFLNRPLKSGDAILLCSDGFWELVYETEMLVDLYKTRTVKDWLQKMELRLQKRMNRTHDNYSAIGVRFL